MENLKAYAITIVRPDGKIEQDIIVSDKVDEDKLEKQAIDNDCTIIVHEVGELSLYDEDMINSVKCKIYNGKGDNHDKF